MARYYMRAHKDSSSGVALAGVKEFVGAGHARENEMKFKCGYPGPPARQTTIGCRRISGPPTYCSRIREMDCHDTESSASRSPFASTGSSSPTMVKNASCDMGALL
jgi:hypothetical protein